jgi:hypothetical protein
MPHIFGHVQNSQLRRLKQTPFKKKVGVVKIESELVTDFPVLFFRQNSGPMAYGQEMGFHPCIIEIGDEFLKSGGKYYVYATDFVSHEQHEQAEDIVKKYTTAHDYHPQGRFPGYAQLFRSGQRAARQLSHELEPIEILMEGTGIQTSNTNRKIVQEARRDAGKSLLSYCKDKNEALKPILKSELNFLKSRSYRKIYFEYGVRRTEEEIIDWIYENAVPFDDMNLGTN